VTAICSGIAQQLSEVDGYHSGLSTGKEGKEEGNDDRIEELSDKEEERKEGHVVGSAAEEEQSQTEEERDARLDKDERQKRSAVVRRKTA